MNVGHFQVPPSLPALPHAPFGHSVVREQLHLGAQRGPHPHQHLLRADEGALVLVHVLLVHLIGQEDDPLPPTEGDELAQVGLREAVARGVAGIYEHQGSHLGERGEGQKGRKGGR